MAINDYAPKSDRKELVDRLSEATHTSKATVYRWLKGQILPPPLKRQVIADVMGIPIEKLFPNDRTEEH